MPWEMKLYRIPSIAGGPAVWADLPALGQGRAHPELVVGFDDGVEDVLENLEGEVGAGFLGIELVGLAGDGHP